MRAIARAGTAICLMLCASFAATLVAAQTRSREIWETAPPMRGQQNEAATAFLNGRIYVIGGFENESGASARVQVFDVAMQTWSDGVPLPEPVHHAGAAVVVGRIYLVGGFD